MIVRSSDGIILFANEAFCSTFGLSIEEIGNSNGNAQAGRISLRLNRSVQPLEPENVQQTSDKLALKALGASEVKEQPSVEQACQWIREGRVLEAYPIQIFYNDPADWPKVLQVFANQGYLRDREVKMQKADGTLLWCSISLQWLTLNGEPAILCVVQNITPYKQQLASLEEILTATSDLFYQCDKSGKFTYVSPNAARTLGMEPKDMLGKTCQELAFPPDIAARLNTQQETVLATGNVVVDEISFLTLEGLRNYEYNLSPIQGVDGSVASIVSTVRDITHRKCLIPDLPETEVKFCTLAEAMAAATFVYQDTQLLYVNSALCRITDYSQNELLRMNVWGFLHPAYQALMREQSDAQQRGEWVKSRYDVKIL
ncbi:MAG: PAS domain S-box protein, partial [Cyanobacteriota bacterium]